MYGTQLKVLLLGSAFLRADARRIDDGLVRLCYRRESDGALISFDADEQSGRVYIIGAKAATSPLTFYQRYPGNINSSLINEWLESLCDQAAAARERHAHLYVNAVNCNCSGDYNCMICDGGLSLCAVCGLIEGSLTSECPGVKCYGSHSERVYRGEIDFVGGAWVDFAVSIHAPSSILTHLKAQSLS